MITFLLACFINGAPQNSNVHFKSIADCNFYKEGLNNQEYKKGGEPQLYKCICKLQTNIDPKKVQVY
jgi:hypothetical protein